MLHALLLATSASTDPITQSVNYGTKVLEEIIPLVVAVLGFMFLLKHKIRDLIILLIIGAIVYSFIAFPGIINNLATWIYQSLGI